ncbi:peptidyl-tRNA hydrolase 2, mitochondrial-like [Vespa mandarinia]|uniref:peptidyl-tRNA hydrolase 2, mitochondrial-like n=1 Tax=Vespa mandarinia TaxID=7446 RepID=UPI00162073C6|nr:peptidyl-tRNA hydrolase 2, mitochondrial-like [Vespa mandarinia]
MLSILKQIMPIFLRTSSIENCKMVIIVRTDIVMGKGKIAAQCAHAALECYRKATANPKKHYMFKDWLYYGQPKIVLRVSSEVELLDLANKAKKVGLTTAIIRDAGRTQLQTGTISVIGIGPGPNIEINKITSHLKLL